MLAWGVATVAVAATWRRREPASVMLFLPAVGASASRVVAVLDLLSSFIMSMAGVTPPIREGADVNP